MIQALEKGEEVLEEDSDEEDEEEDDDAPGEFELDHYFFITLI